MHATTFLGVALLALSWGGVEFYLDSERDRAQAASIQNTTNLAHLFEDHIVRLIKANDRILRALQVSSVNGTLSADFVDQQVKMIAQQNFNGDMEKFRVALAQGGMTLERFRSLQEKMIIVQAMKKKFEESVPAPTEADIAAAVAELPPQRSIKISTLTVADQDSARVLLGKLKSGADFVALAKENSKDSRASDGGASDWIEVTSLSPELAKAIAALKPGQLSAVLPLGSAFMILRLDQERQTTADQLTREQKVEAAQTRNRRLGLDKTLKDLRSKARIQMITP